MGKTMTPSEQAITSGQISKLQDLFSARLRKSGLPGEAVQEAVETFGGAIADEMVAAVRKRVDEMISKRITRHVKVDRSRSPQEAIDGTGHHKWYIDEVVLAEMPRDGFAEGTVEVFELDYDPTVEELNREYESRGLKPDPYAAARLMMDDHAFADERPLVVQWRDKQGRACYVFFGRLGDRRCVDVGRGGSRWRRYYRFAGVRK